MFHNQTVSTHFKEQNLKKSWKLVKKQKNYSKSKNVKNNAQKTQNFYFKNT